MPFIVYKITNAINNHCYIGVTKKTAEKRFKEHVYSAVKRNVNRKLYYAIRKYGIDNFSHESICSILSDAHVLEMETHFIRVHDSFNNGYNMNEGGYGLRYHTEETKQKMSDRNFWRGKSRTGVEAPMFGKNHTEETKQKIRTTREANKHKYITKRNPHTEETKKKISDAKKGKESSRKGAVLSDDTKQKIREAQLRRDSSSRVRNTYEVKFPDGHTEIVPNMVDFCLRHSLNIKEMRKVAKGRAKTHKKFVCVEVSKINASTPDR